MNPLRWRKITWVLDLWVAAFAIWMMAGLGSPSPSCDMFGTGANCGIQPVIEGGQMAAFLVWCVGFVVLSFAWLMTSGRARVQR
jgi:hypothetical protein